MADSYFTVALPWLTVRWWGPTHLTPPLSEDSRDSISQGLQNIFSLFGKSLISAFGTSLPSKHKIIGTWIKQEKMYMFALSEKELYSCLHLAHVKWNLSVKINEISDHSV